jgi:uncharacterized delta-60 repeat protein
MLALLTLLFCSAATITAAPGDLDPTFGNGGIVITRGINGNNPNYLSTVGAMAIQPDGKIVVVGEGHDGTFNFCAWDFAVVRYNTDGSLDTSFGGTGRVVTQLSSECSHAYAVAIQPDGKIVVAGSGWVGPAVIRYNPNGTLDTSFNGTGIVIPPSDGANSIAIQADGKIVVAGFSNFVRYNPNGSLDTSFNSSGKVILPVGVGASSVAIQADGKIIATGGTGFNGTSFTLVRYNADGSLDTSFNGTGTVITSVGNSGSGPRDLAIQTDGKIVVVGDSLAAAGNWKTADFAIVRYNPDGSLDTSFGGTGKILIPDSDSVDSVRSVAIQPNGKIVVAGDTANIGSDSTVASSDFALVRLNPNGSLDTSFVGTGTTITSVGNAWDTACSVAIQPDGRIVVAGDTGPDDFKDFVVVRYQGDGATPTSCSNPIDCADFFVGQHYRDFLNREPDAAGLAFWTNEITFCGSDPQCVEAKRINVSAAYFLSIEFQQSGYLVYRFYKAAFGNLPGAPVPVRRSDFLPDAQALGQGVIVNQGNWQQQLETNKQNFANAFVQRAAFTSTYPTSMSPDAFVDTLFANAGVIPSSSERAEAVAEFGSAANTADTAARARALLLIAENSTLQQQEFNRAFVLMQYFGYLRRNPNDAPEAGLNFDGYNFWLNKLNSFNGDFVQAEMVKAFLLSTEYRQRFGL